MAAESEGATYLAFRDTFSRFFLNPEYLMERKEEAWKFMIRIDQALSETQPNVFPGSGTAIYPGALI